MLMLIVEVESPDSSATTLSGQNALLFSVTPKLENLLP